MGICNGANIGYLKVQYNRPRIESLIVKYLTRKPAEKRYFATIQRIRYTHTLARAQHRLPGQNLPSRYARNVRNPINRISPTKISHDRNVDHEKIRCRTKMLVNSSADCHA